MNILILFDDTKKFCMLISSIIPRLRKDFSNSSIEVFSDSDYCRKFLAHIPGISDISSNIILNEYDKVFCFDDSVSHLIEYRDIKCKEYIGYTFSENQIHFTCKAVEKFFNCYCLKSGCDDNILSSFFNAFGFSWNKEGFNISYRAKSKSKDDRSGVAISNDNLRSFVKMSMFSHGEKLWHIPIRQDPLKCIDEVNKCSNIVTDNIFYAFVGSFLRKKIIFLVEDGCSFSPDIFNDIFIQHLSLIHI